MLLRLKNEIVYPGVEIHAVTQGDAIVSNIYCERPFSSADGESFLFFRQTDRSSPGDWPVWELVRCRFGDWVQDVVAEGQFSVCISYQDDFYLSREIRAGRFQLERIERGTGRAQTVWEYAAARPLQHPTVSPNGRYLAYHGDLSYQPQRFAVMVVDLHTGAERVVLERPDVWNAHAQFQATDNATLLVQVNRGARFAPNGERLTRYGPEGNTLMLLDIHSGALRPLAVGRPHTTSPTGHECWLGQTQTVLATIFRPGQSPLPGPDPEMGLAPDLGTVITLRENEAYRQVPSGQVLMHIGSTFDGRFYHGDWIEQDRLVIGSARTGRAVIVYRDPAASDDCPFDQHSHPHAYLTDNGRWMIFNSDRTGRPQIYAARIPPALLEEVERGS